MSKVKNENYMVIQGFMVNELNLKGNDLLVYAIIYGFSQIEGQRYTGGLQYLADWTNSTKQGVMKNLKSLIEKGLIEKEEKIINGVKFVEYYVTKFNGVLNKVEWGIKQSLPNNIDNNIDNNIEKEIYKEKVRKTASKNAPSLDEVKEYIKEKKLDVDAVQFFNYFDTGNWIDSKGNRVKNWKQKLLTWNSFNNKKKDIKQKEETEEEKIQRKIKALEESLKNGN